jgi:tetratricopeptide (TPR) repeat protein
MKILTRLPRTALRLCILVVSILVVSILVVSILCQPLFSFAAALTNTSSHSNDMSAQKKLLAGIDNVYRMRFSDALAAFDDAIAHHPNEPHAYFFRASVFLWRYMFEGSEPDARRFWTASERTLQVADAAQKANPVNLHPQVIRGAMYAFRAMANFKAENFVKGTLDMRTCYNELSTVLKQDPAQYDAYLGLGMFHFVMGALPKPVRMMANLTGMKGDCALGLKELEIAAQKSLYASNDAKMCLAMLHIYFNKDYATGLRYLNEMLARYPGNVPMLYTLGNVQFFLKKMPLAIEQYKAVKRLADTNFRMFTTFANYRLGEAYFRLNDFAQAKPYFQQFFAAPFERSFRAASLLRLAMMLEMEGKRDEAVKGYRKAAEMTLFTEPEDRYAIRKAKYFLQTSLDAPQIQLVRGVNCVESARYAESETLLLPLAANTTLAADLRAEAWYYLGEAARRERRSDEALKRYQQAVEAAPLLEKWIPPFAYIRMAEIYRASGKETLAQAFVQKTRVFSGYDFEEQILFALERDISMLK